MNTGCVNPSFLINSYRERNSDVGKTNIGWVDKALNWYTWNCNHVSPGCQHCYAEALALKFNRPTFAGAPTWRVSAIRDYKALKVGESVFVNTMSDSFHEKAPVRYLHWIFQYAIERPDVQFLLLTKRVERAYYLAPYLPWAENIWLGTSVENADWAWRIEWLKRIPARHKFVSFEPLLGYVGDIDLTGIDQAITGGESGAQRRPFYSSFATQIRDICHRDGVSFFHKQGGHRYPGMDRLLDGVLHDDLAWQKRSAS